MRPRRSRSTPDSQTVYVADETSSVAKGNNVTPISTSSLSASAPIAVQKAPTGLAVTPDGSTLWVVCSGAGSLEPINLAATPVAVETEGTVAVVGGPYAIALVTEQHSVAVRSLGAAPAKKKKTSPSAEHRTGCRSPQRSCRLRVQADQRVLPKR